MNYDLPPGPAFAPSVRSQSTRPPSESNDTQRELVRGPPLRSGQHPLKMLQDLFLKKRRARCDDKIVARGHIAAAMVFLREQETLRAHDQLSHFIKHCKTTGLNVEHELNRSEKSEHPFAQMLKHEDYDGISMLAPLLDAACHESTMVWRHSQGTYIGQVARSADDGSKTYVAHGQGVMLKSDGTRIQGLWLNDAPTEATVFPTSGDIREYRGSLMKGKYDGQGRARYQNEDHYTGNWRNGKPDGHGILTTRSGDTLRAIWRNGVIQPDAEFETEDGRVYWGDIDLRTGLPRGKMTIAWISEDMCGAYYDGFVHDGQPSGSGRYVYGVNENLSGFVYDGAWFKGEKHGCGVLTRQVDQKRFKCSYINGIIQKNNLSKNPAEQSRVLFENSPLIDEASSDSCLN